MLNHCEPLGNGATVSDTDQFGSVFVHHHNETLHSPHPAFEFHHNDVVHPLLTQALLSDHLVHPLLDHQPLFAAPFLA
jgi:hypothetical protein